MNIGSVRQLMVVFLFPDIGVPLLVCDKSLRSALRYETNSWPQLWELHGPALRYETNSWRCGNCTDEPCIEDSVC